MSNFTDIFIRRPVLAIVIAIFILLTGIVSYFYLPISEYPHVDASKIEVNTTWKGATPDVIESYITNPIEEAIGRGGISGVDFVYSNSELGRSNIGVVLKLGYDAPNIISEVVASISTVRRGMPVDMDDPQVEKHGQEAMGLMYISVTSDQMSLLELTDYVSRIIRPQLLTVDGVRTIDIDGASDYAMRFWIDPYSLAARNVALNELSNAVIASIAQGATGEVQSGKQIIPINTLTNLSTAQQFNDIVVRSDNDQLIKLGDLGRIELGSEQQDFSEKIDNHDGIVLPIFVKPDANSVAVSDGIRKALGELQKYFPAHLHVKVLLDNADYIRASIFEIQKTLIIASVLVMLIVFIFLGSLRVLLIPAVAIPLSIIGVFSVMLVLDYSLNTLTLLALVLAVGMVVDDAIVVMENIYRHILLGKSPKEAALIGAREIQFAVISITLTLAAVYAPIGLTTGLTKVLFKEFAFTLAAAVIISGAIALILTPLLCSTIITPNILSGKFSLRSHELIVKIAAIYQNFLNIILKMRLKVVVFLFLTVIATVVLYQYLPKELAPSEDVGWITGPIKVPASTNLDYVKKYAAKLSDVFEALPEKASYVIGLKKKDEEKSFVMLLKPWGERKKTTDEVIQDLQKQFTNIAGIQVYAENPHTMPGASTSVPIGVIIQTTGTYEELYEVVKKVIAQLRTNSRLYNIDTDLKIDHPRVDVIIDRNKAGVLGIPIQNIINAIDLAFGEPRTATFTMNGQNYEFIAKLDPLYQGRIDALTNLQLRTNIQSADQTTQLLVPLSNLVTIKETSHPDTLLHYQRQRAARISIHTAPGYALNEALNDVESVIKKIIPANMKIDYSDQARQFKQTGNKMALTFAFAIIFIFLVLAVQFESFIDPLVVMLTVPFSMLGAMLILWVTGGTINIYTQIGLITLVGLITKHGILLVTFANQRSKEGATIYEAIIDAAKIRLRPILMTTVAMILGALPLALATGAGSHCRKEIGWVIIGGMSIGTLFTLFVIPVMYTLLVKSKNKISN